MRKTPSPPQDIKPRPLGWGETAPSDHTTAVVLMHFTSRSISVHRVHCYDVRYNIQT